MTQLAFPRVFRVLTSLAVVAFITAAFEALNLSNLTTAGLIYLITVLLVAAKWGFLEAAIASIAAAACLNYFFVPPIGTLHIANVEDWVVLASFLVTSLVAGQLSELARKRHAQLLQRQEEMARLYELNRKAEAARESERFKSTLLDAVAHEFKTPLTSIKAAASTILTSPTISPEQSHELLSIIGQEADRLSRLMKETFHLARVESGKLHLSRSHRDVVGLIQEAIKEAIALNGRQLETTFSPQLPRLDVDPELFVLALKQLFDNAAKYSPGGTPIRITAETSADSVWIRVRNQGDGLSETEQVRVFERFYRSPATSGDIPGTGIGLSIARDIVMAHGGFIDVESGPGMGTEFSIRLPLRKESEG